MSLENFKAFGQRSSIPLAPITLIFGENSAGKSSILHSLNLLKQTRESRNVDAPLLLRTENGLVDLGSFKELIFDHKLNNILSIRLDTKVGHQQRSPAYPKFLRDKLAIGLDLSFARRSARDEITLDGLRLCGDIDSSYIAEFKATDVPESLRVNRQTSYRSDRPLRNRQLTAVRCTKIGDETDHWRTSYADTQRNRSKLIKLLEAANSKVSTFTNTMFANFFGDDVSISRPDFVERRQALHHQIKHHIAFLSEEFSYDSYIDWMTRQQIGTIVFLDGFIPVAARSGDGERSIDDILYRLQNSTLIRREWSTDLGYALVHAGQVLENTLSSVFPLGPFRQPPLRWYMFTGTTPQDVGYQGNLLPDLLFRHHDLLAQTNDWLRRLDIGYELEPRQLGGFSADLFELRLKDKRRRSIIDVGLSDVGYGISQILPLVVQSLAGTDQIITIEQPEVHIHPRLQADIGDLLVESISDPRRNQFIIETHSEHLALRLQRRIRDKACSLSPKDVSILYVSRGPNGATVQSIRLDDEGDFMDEIPGGFFPERLREIR
jgi:predicted ATPase